MTNDFAVILSDIYAQHPEWKKFKFVETIQNTDQLIYITEKYKSKANSFIAWFQPEQEILDEDEEIFGRKIRPDTPFQLIYEEKKMVIHISQYKFSDHLRPLAVIFFDDRNYYLKQITKPRNETFYPIGIYNVATAFGQVILEPIDMTEVSEPVLNDNLNDEIQQDIDTFFKNRDFYKKHGFAFKRGLLLYGSPGTGKTSLIKYILKNNSDKYGIVADSSKDYYNELHQLLKISLGGKPSIIIFEDIDGMGPYNRSMLLNFLDGVAGLDNVFFIATSNDITKIDEAIFERPSRFDRVYNIDLPNEKCRAKLLLRFFPELKSDQLLLSECVQNTKGFSGAYFKELFILKNIRNVTIKKAIQIIQEQLKTYKDYQKDYHG